MLSYSAGDKDVPLLETTIGTQFESVVTRFPDRQALIEAQPPQGGRPRHWTYQELNNHVDALALALMNRGFAAGDRLGIWSPNCAEWVMFQYATAKIGVILVNVNPAYRSHELEFVVNQNGMRSLVVAPQDKNSDYPAMARQALENCPQLTELVFLPGSDDAAGPLTAGVPQTDAELSYQQLVSGKGNRAGTAAAPPGVNPAHHTAAQLAERMASLTTEDPINIQYTSGTTGFPKGATLTHRNILNNGHSIGALLNYTEQDKVVIPVPFYHCFGMVIGNLNVLSHGGCVIVPSRGFTPTSALQAVHDFGATSLYGVPTMFIAELALPNFDDYDLSSLRTGVMAGSLCPVEVMKQVISRMNMKDVAICYGMTETSPVSTMTRDGDTLAQRTESVGRTMPHLESQIVDPGTGEVVERGQIGELCTRGYAVMKGYWGQEEKTAEAIDPEGWMHTGDLARMDADGYILVEGRIKDMVIRGGENIYPREIEEFLYSHPDIQDVQVIGIPDQKYGEELMACIILKDGADPLDAETVREFCSGRLAHYKVPRYVQVRESFPMTVSGKIRKVEMRQEAIEKLGL
ncbi:AMP-binding protein [Pseudarthrobacter sp. J1738]|uniref:AMP-binding protein n=1 Tax=Pseudarthrobacter sp. J1738 TaxID=3420446 RepID=UPI003D2C8086